MPDFRISNSITDAYIQLYSEIAAEDIYHSMQSDELLSNKADEDFKRILKYAEFIKKKNKGNLKILEIGPGQGHLSKRLIEQGFDFTATDIVPHYLKDLKCKVFLSDVEKMPTFEEKFDVIIACDVFEHVLNEGDSALSVITNLKPGGFVYVRSPYDEPLINYSQQLGAPFPFVHLRTYTRKSLKNLMFAAGASKVVTGLQGLNMVTFARRCWVMPDQHWTRNRFEIGSGYNKDYQVPVYSRSYQAWVRLEKILYRIVFEKFNLIPFQYIYKRFYFRNIEVWAIAFKREKNI
jgi:2-polyprenyl-3-methyl-5-hydroxy-6-metoxy-1,4-benzoquinol methylase